MNYQPRIVQPKDYKSIIEESNYVKRLHIRNSSLILGGVLILIESLSIFIPSTMFIILLMALGLISLLFSHKVAKKLTQLQINHNKNYRITIRLSVLTILIICGSLIICSFF